MDKLDYQELKKFKGIIAEIRMSKFIVAEAKFKKLLKFIASSDLFMALFGDCMEGFNFEYEYMKASVSLTTENGTETKFVLPADLGYRIALVFSILYYIDIEMLDFLEFTNEFFTSEETHQTYKNFIKTVIDPFEKDVEFLLTGVSFVQEEIDNIEGANDGDYISMATVESVLNELKILDNIIISTKKLTGTEKEEINVLLDAFSNTLTALDIPNAKISWYGLKNSIKKVPRVSKVITAIDEILAKFL
ncbi:MAG: hypothetical protein R3Y18_01125 [Bacillota bacterium]